MLRPTNGEILEGLRRGLMNEVLPAVPAGAAARQLRAAIHVLGKLAATWDLQHRYLDADNKDLDRTLESLVHLTGIPRKARAGSRGTAFAGISDLFLAELALDNDDLQTELEAHHRQWRASGRHDGAVDIAFRDLYVRMTERAAEAAGCRK
jgi:hypothetical protein